MLQRQLQLCYSCTFSLTTYCSLCFLSNLFSSIIIVESFVSNRSFVPFLIGNPPLFLCSIPEVGKNGVVNEDRKCRDQKAGFAFLSCNDFFCFHGHICFSPFYG